MMGDSIEEAKKTRHEICCPVPGSLDQARLSEGLTTRGPAGAGARGIVLHGPTGGIHAAKPIPDDSIWEYDLHLAGPGEGPLVLRPGIICLIKSHSAPSGASLLVEGAVY